MATSQHSLKSSAGSLSKNSLKQNFIEVWYLAKMYFFRLKICKVFSCLTNIENHREMDRNFKCHQLFRFPCKNWHSIILLRILSKTFSGNNCYQINKKQENETESNCTAIALLLNFSKPITSSFNFWLPLSSVLCNIFKRDYTNIDSMFLFSRTNDKSSPVAIFIDDTRFNSR